MNILLTTSAAPVMSPLYTNERRPPIGLGFLISVLRGGGHRVFFIDNYLKPSNFLATDYLIANKIDLIGIQANTQCFRDTRRILNKIQDMRERGIWRGNVVVGGPHTSVAVETIPDFVDYIVQGEGEMVIADIVDGRQNSRVIKAERIRELDELPPPAWDYFINLPYDFGAWPFPDRPVFSMNTSRGCPFRCAFCSVGSIWGKEYTYFSAPRIIEDIKHLIKIYGAKGIFFREDNFTTKRERVAEFCELLVRQNIGIKWLCETRVDTLDEPLLKLMHRAGCRGLYIGVESGSQRLLDFLNKGTTIEQVERVFGWCRELGIKTHAAFMVGIPTETPGEREQTIKFSQKIETTKSSFNVFVGIPRSKLYDYVLEKELYQHIDNRRLVYIKGHDAMVCRFGIKPLTMITPKLGFFIRALPHLICSPKPWVHLATLVLPLPIIRILRNVKQKMENRKDEMYLLPASQL